LLVEFLAKTVYIPALSRDVYLVPYLEVYRPAVLIGLGPLFLLSLLDPVIGDFLCAIYSLGELYYFISGELFIDAYRFVYCGPRLVKAYTGYIT
jgi:hypothetical protein